MIITQKQIAQALGVSHQLVSFALNGGGTVSEQRRREILQAAHDMGYRRNELARAMVTGKSHIIGVLTYDEGIEHIATIVAGALQEAVKDGYAVKVLHVPFDDAPGEIVAVAHRCAAWQLDGVVAVSLKTDAIAVLSEELKNSRCPVAYIENVPTGSDDILVRTDDRSAFGAAVEHLNGLGHGCIVHLCGPDEHPISQARNAIFLDILREIGLPFGPDSLVHTHATAWMPKESIERATHALLDRKPRPTAVICAGDASAMILMRTARRRGVRVPEDLSVIGFGNFALGAHADPPLSSIAQPFRDMGRLAMQRLIATINDPAASGHACGLHELPARLVVRESTAPPAD